MNEKLAPYGRVDLFKELARRIFELRDDPDADLQASKILTRSYSTTQLVGLTEAGDRVVYRMQNPSLDSDRVWTAPFDKGGVTGNESETVWREGDESNGFDDWFGENSDQFDWVHPDFQET